MSSDLSTFAARLRGFFSSGATLSPSAFETLALELFALQFAANNSYRSICTARGKSPQNVTHWTQIPLVPTLAFKEFEMTSLPPHQRIHCFHSSGTTEHRPGRHFHGHESLTLYDYSAWTWFRAHLLADCDQSRSKVKLINLTPSASQTPHSSLVRMFEVVRGRMGLDASAFVGRVSRDGSWVLDFDAALPALEVACESGAIVMLLGTAFSFVHLMDELAARNLRFQLPPGARVMETGGYKGRSRSLPKSRLHALIAHHLGVPPSRIICEYGMSELGSQAYDGAIEVVPNGRDQNTSRRFQFPPWARVQIISPETEREVAKGETGLIRVFDLANVFSALAIQTEDLGVRHESGFEFIGRTADVEPRGCSLMTV